jgi:hypothetical protein
MITNGVYIPSSYSNYMVKLVGNINNSVTHFCTNFPLVLILNILNLSDFTSEVPHHYHVCKY